MAGENEVNRDNTERLLEERDKINPSPQVRANAIWNILNNHEPRPTLWDLICFSTETLTIAAGDSYPFLTKIVKALVSNVYTIHYYGDEVIDSFVKVDGEFKK